MKVKAIINIGTNDFREFALTNGEESDVPDGVAARMVRMGVAVRVVDPPKAEPEADKFTEMRAEHINPPKSKPASSK